MSAAQCDRRYQRRQGARDRQADHARRGSCCVRPRWRPFLESGAHRDQPKTPNATAMIHWILFRRGPSGHEREIEARRDGECGDTREFNSDLRALHRRSPHCLQGIQRSPMRRGGVYPVARWFLRFRVFLRRPFFELRSTFPVDARERCVMSTEQATTHPPRCSSLRPTA